MKFTFAWLKDHLDTAAPLEELTGRLSSMGLEVEGVEDPRMDPFAGDELLVRARVVPVEQGPEEAADNRPPGALDLVAGRRRLVGRGEGGPRRDRQRGQDPLGQDRLLTLERRAQEARGHPGLARLKEHPQRLVIKAAEVAQHEVASAGWCGVRQAAGPRAIRPRLLSSAT